MCVQVSVNSGKSEFLATEIIFMSLNVCGRAWNEGIYETRNRAHVWKIFTKVHANIHLYVCITRQFKQNSYCQFCL